MNGETVKFPTVIKSDQNLSTGVGFSVRETCFIFNEDCCHMLGVKKLKGHRGDIYTVLVHQKWLFSAGKIHCNVL